MLRTFITAALAPMGVAVFSVPLYVDGTNGNDLNDGLTVATAWATIQKSFDSAQPGDSVFISDGFYTEHPILHVSGLPGQRIWFGGYNNEPVHLLGDASLGSTMIKIEDQSYVTLSRFHLANLYTPDAQGILIRCTPNGTVKDVVLDRAQLMHISWTGNETTIPGPDDNAQPIVVYGEGITQENAISGLQLRFCSVTSCITGFSEAISLDGNITGALVENCFVGYITNIGIQFGGGYGVCSVPALDNARNSTVSSCIVENCQSLYATSAGIYVDGADSILVFACEVRESGYGIEIGCEENGETVGVRVISCLVHDNRNAGLAIGGYDDQTTGQVIGALVRNNDFFNNDLDASGTGEVVITKATACDLHSNIFFASEQNILLTREDIEPQGDLSFDYNDWFTLQGDPDIIEADWGGTTLSGYGEFIGTTGWEVHGVFSDPMLTSEVPGNILPSLLAGSPCIDAGDPATQTISAEGPGRVQGQWIDIGLAEFPQSTATLDRQTSGIIIGPVPCDGELIIQGLPRGSVVQLSDVSGRIAREPSTVMAGTMVVSDLSPGTYLLGVRAPACLPMFRRIVRR